MKQYKVTVTEKIISSFIFYTESANQAYEAAIKILETDFCAPYHDSVDVIDYEVYPVSEVN